MIKVDLHTHSVDSPDGGLTFENYQTALAQSRLNCVAITDHNTIKFAHEAFMRLGDCIIVGEEIMTQEGEIIGLFLTKKIMPDQTLQKTVADIKEQKGIVYVPHPFEIVRSGISLVNLNLVAKDIDIIETHNGRAIFQNHTKQTHAWANRHMIAEAASSDAHGVRGWCRTYTEIMEKPTPQNIVPLMHDGYLSTQTVGIPGLLYPKLNRLKKKNQHAE